MEAENAAEVVDAIYNAIVPATKQLNCFSPLKICLFLQMYVPFH